MVCNLIFFWICIHYIEGTGAGVPVLFMVGRWVKNISIIIPIYKPFSIRCKQVIPRRRHYNFFINLKLIK